MKRLVVCCDGTWQSLDNDWPTNVQRVAQFVRQSTDNGTAQVVYYSSGVGAAEGLTKFTEGAFGHGLDREIREAYEFLCLNYEPGDEIYLFGFSRGAYTVRSLAGLVYACGVVVRRKIRAVPEALSLYRDREIEPGDDECINFRSSYCRPNDPDAPAIHFLGCWDTVGALGVPDAIPFLPIDNWIGGKYEFHDLHLGSHIRHARHAVAVDERRKVFDVTRMLAPSKPLEDHSLQEIWFPGDHGGVGGGARETRELSDGALLWMVNEASAAGLEFIQDELNKFTDSDPLIDFEKQSGFLRRMTGRLHDRQGPDTKATVSEAAISRWSKKQTYRPETLKKALS